MSIQLPDKVLDSLTPRLNRWIIRRPTPKQRLFLLLPHMEAFYGGAAGGGKSEALLMAALQYVDVPGYSAIIFRKTLTDASKANASLDRAKSWLVGQPGVETKGSKFTFYPSGATLEFGGLKDSTSKYSYQSAEYQFIGFDELTHFSESDFSFLFSRCRKRRCPDHQGDANPECPICKVSYILGKTVPLRIRAASNPGGFGHEWVKRRYNIRKHPVLKRPNGDPVWIGTNPRRPHIPAFVEDNPYIDPDYLSMLSELDPVTRDQMRGGDWGATASGRIKPGWFKRYNIRGSQLNLTADFSDPVSYHFQDCRRFQVIDVAASTDEGLAEAGDAKRSYTNIATFYITPSNKILWIDNECFRAESPAMIRRIIRSYKKHRPEGCAMEVTAVSTHIYKLLLSMGLNMVALTPGGRDKVARSISACNRAFSGGYYLPAYGISPYVDTWLDVVESQLFYWLGLDEQTDDIVDCFAYSSIYMDTVDPNSLKREVDDAPEPLTVGQLFG